MVGGIEGLEADDSWAVVRVSNRPDGARVEASISDSDSDEGSRQECAAARKRRMEEEEEDEVCVAVVPQTPWIIGASLRANILLGRPYEGARYQAVSSSPPGAWLHVF